MPVWLLMYLVIKILQFQVSMPWPMAMPCPCHGHGMGMGHGNDWTCEVAETRSMFCNLFYRLVGVIVL